MNNLVIKIFVIFLVIIMGSIIDYFNYKKINAWIISSPSIDSKKEDFHSNAFTQIDLFNQRLQLLNKNTKGYIVLFNKIGKPFMEAEIKNLSSLGVSNTDGFIYFWTANRYFQWNGDYLYSDKPIVLDQFERKGKNEKIIN